MKVLGIDAATPRAGVSVLIDGAEASRRLAPRPEETDSLLDLVDGALGEAGLGLDDLDGVAATTGPGSFTGLRTGIAVVQGLLFGSRTPCVGVSTLEAMSRTVDTGSERVVVPVLDARRDAVFAAAYRNGETLLPPGVHAPADLAACVGPGPGALFVGPAEPRPRARSGLAALRSFPGLDWAPVKSLERTAAEVARLGAAALGRGLGASADRLRPLYHRASEAETAAALRFRPFVAADLEAALRIEAVSYPHPWSRRMFEEEIENPNTVALAAEEDGRLVGYALGWVIVDDLHVNNIAIDHDRRHAGRGSALLAALFRAAAALGARRATLEVRPSNAAALALYRRAGFREVGVRKRYYEDGEDALLLWLDRIG